MKYLFLFLILSGCAPKVKTSIVKVDIQNYVDDAVARGLVEEYPIYVLSDISVKYLSREWMKNKYYKGIKRTNLFLIPKSCTSAQQIWGEGAQNGVLVNKSAAYSKPQTKNTKYIYDGMEITSKQKDTINIDNVEDVIYIKIDRITYDFCFISSVK